MSVQTQSRFKSVLDLKNFIYTTICKREGFAVGAFPMMERVLRKGEKACGFLFSVYGPRSVTCNAIYETENHAVHFYGAGGERIASVPVHVALLR